VLDQDVETMTKPHHDRNNAMTRHVRTR